MPSPFGGTPGKWGMLTPLPNPANYKAYRVIPGEPWWRFVFLEWRVHLANLSVGVNVPAPFLKPTMSPSLYITDEESLRGLVSPTDFATRLCLSHKAHLECTYGCAIVEFDLSNYRFQLPKPLNHHLAPGVTAQGAREWIVTDDVELDRSMRVRYVEIGPHGPRFYDITL